MSAAVPSKNSQAETTGARKPPAFKSEMSTNDPPEKGAWRDFAIAGQASRLAIGGLNTEKRGLASIWQMPAAAER
jgi:hypothetical protein